MIAKSAWHPRFSILVHVAILSRISNLEERLAVRPERVAFDPWSVHFLFSVLVISVVPLIKVRIKIHMKSQAAHRQILLKLASGSVNHRPTPHELKSIGNIACLKRASRPWRMLVVQNETPRRPRRAFPLLFRPIAVRVCLRPANFASLITASTRKPAVSSSNSIDP